ncbi:hypothetical protein BDM02DRAFT_2534148 [Thelephora ganbajun]|uniref:Uncharacterized protein n=1 Tax=Thelephora ganbajun TaxID=370292 RepID=A0ACB6ZDZ4_THEGA|nr:hypothetical protein BDM02DRAFT_2534148 [Thelephora ganbajun]
MPGLGSQARFIAHTSSFTEIDLESTQGYLLKRLKNEVARVHRHEAQSFYPSVYVETSGFVLMDWRVADLNLSDIPTPELEAAAQQACARMVRSVSLKPPKDASRVSFMETHVGCAAVLIVQHLTRPEGGKPLLDCHSYQRCVLILRSAVKLALYRPVQASNVPLMPYDGCEVLYGRAGLLYGLLFLRSNITAEIDLDGPLSGDIKALTSFDTLRKVVDDVIDRGTMGAEVTRPPGVTPSMWPPLMWSWHHKLYLGAAHGVAGILQMIVSCPLDTIAAHIPIILQTVEWLLHVQCEDGNWSSKASEGPPTERQEWCHGAPGLVILFSTILKRAAELSVSPGLQSRLKSAVHRASDLIYAEGFLKKGVGLCHGVSGSVFALLAASDTLDGHDKDLLPERFYQAVHLAVLGSHWHGMTRRGELRRPDAPYSLYEGLSGLCTAYAAILERITPDGEWRGLGSAFRGMPGYDDVMIQMR